MDWRHGGDFERRTQLLAALPLEKVWTMRCGKKMDKPLRGGFQVKRHLLAALVLAKGQNKISGTGGKEERDDKASKKKATKNNKPDPEVNLEAGISPRSAKENRGGRPGKTKPLQDYLLQITKDYLKKCGVSQGAWRSSHHAALKHRSEFWCKCAPKKKPMTGYTALQSWLMSKHPIEECPCKLCHDTLLRKDVNFKPAELLELYKQVTDFFQRGL